MKKFVKAVLITTILSVVTRALGLFIKVYLSREIGATALGYYQISLSVFFLLCTLVTSGIPLVISRKIASKPADSPKIVFAGMIVSLIIATIVCSLTIIFPQIFISLWGQKSSLGVLYSLLPAVIFTALYVPFRGGFWGHKNFFLLGFTELIEQIFRFMACFMFFVLLSTSLSGEMIAGITYSIACVFSSIVAIAIYIIKKNKIKPNFSYIKPIIIESAPIAIVRISSSLITLLISIILPKALLSTGLSLEDSIGQFGIVTGMVLPLITIPGTLISSISVAITPELSGKTDNFIKRQINNSLSYSIIISSLLLPAFLTLGSHIGLFLYNDSLAGQLLKVGSILFLPLGINQITSSILNAIGKEKEGLISYLVGAAIMVVCITTLPKIIGIYSLLAGMFGMSTISSLINLFFISKYLSTLSLKTFLASFIFLLPSCLLSSFTYGILSHFLPTIITISIAGIISITMIIMLYYIFKFIDLKDFVPKKFRFMNKSPLK